MPETDKPHIYSAEVGLVGRHKGFLEAVNIEPWVFVANDPPGLHEVMNLAHYGGIVLSIGFFQDNGTWNTVEGSAVMVGPGIVATATHVFEELTDRIKLSQLRMILACAVGDNLRVWFPRKFHTCVGTDISIIEVELISELPQDRLFVQAALTTRLPAIGEAIMLVGFRASERHVEAIDHVYFPKTEGQLRFGLSAFCSVGYVTQHNLGETASIVPGVTVTTDCAALGGMSGGPAFDCFGHVFGILSASAHSPDGTAHSTVSLIAQALAVRAQPSFIPGYFTGEAPTLLSNRLVTLEGRELVSMGNDPDRLEIEGW